MADPKLGSADRPLRVAVIGSGPSAFYAVDALQKTQGLHVRVDMFDRLPTPFGLVRGGVAPDHPKIKTVAKIYEKIAAKDGFRFFGNVMLGRDIHVDDLREHYDHIVYGTGAETDRKLGIPGEELKGVFSATEFVGWYNAHPDYRDRDFDLDHGKSVAVVGNGNVSMDVTRILIQDPEVLRKTDIADYAVKELTAHRVEEVHLLGRRGPAQAAFSPKEIREVAEVENADLVVLPDEAELDELSQGWLAVQNGRSAQKNVDFLLEQSQLGEGDKSTKVRCRFLVSPVEILGDASSRVRAIRIERGRLEADAKGTPRPKGTGEFEEIPVQLVFKAVGYRGVPIAGVPFCESWGLIPNSQGRVLEARDGERVSGQYVVGWAKRGPTGLVGTNSPDSKETVKHMVEDLDGVTATALTADEAEAVPALLADRGVDVVTWEDWRRLDTWELEQGSQLGKFRQKPGSVAELMRIIHELRAD